MTETALHTNKSHHQQQRWGPFTLIILAFISYLTIAAIRTYRGMDLLEKNNQHHHNLRSDFFDQPRNKNNLSRQSLALRSSIDPFDPLWDERLFSPLIQSFFPEQLEDMDRMMWMEPTFQIHEEKGSVKLTTSIPDIPLKDIDIEVVDGRIIHIKGTKTTDSSHVSFDRRFSIGQKVDEAKLEAKLTKDGVLEVSAPEVLVDEKEVVRKIPVTLAEEL
jgi:HSP20 family molecular chaperone IbpA